MYEKIIGDGYAYCFAGDGINLRDDHPNAPIFLMPYGRYEDIGILYHVNYKGRDYQIYYYSKDTAYQTNDINKYISQRFGFDNVKMVNDKYALIHGGVDSTPEVSAFFDLDKGHYCKVRTFGTENELMEILNVLDRKNCIFMRQTTALQEKSMFTKKKAWAEILPFILMKTALSPTMKAVSAVISEAVHGKFRTIS